jgi:SnoaL-like domain
VTTDAASLVQRYWDRMNDNDWAAAAELFSDGFVLTWPQTGERIRSKSSFVSFNAHYPVMGRWRFTINKFVAAGSSAVTEVHVTDGDVEAIAITFFEADGTGISRMTEYWPDPQPAAEWRRQWVELF